MLPCYWHHRSDLNVTLLCCHKSTGHNIMLLGIIHTVLPFELKWFQHNVRMLPYWSCEDLTCVRPMTMETRCCQVFFPNFAYGVLRIQDILRYSKIYSAEDTLVPPLKPGHYRPFEGLWSVGTWGQVFATTCSRSASLGPWTKKLAVSPSLPLFTAVSMLLKYLVCDIWAATAVIVCGIRGGQNLGR